MRNLTTLTMLRGQVVHTVIADALNSVKPLGQFYRADYGDDRDCKCGHPYYRHFDTYPQYPTEEYPDGERMAPVGCKYCQCTYEGGFRPAD